MVKVSLIQKHVDLSCSRVLGKHVNIGANLTQLLFSISSMSHVLQRSTHQSIFFVWKLPYIVFSSSCQLDVCEMQEVTKYASTQNVQVLTNR